MFVLPVSNLYTPVTIRDQGCRTKAQMRAVSNLVSTIDFACSNPFEQEFPGQRFTCTFVFLFYRNNALNAVRITPTGKVHNISF